MFKPYKMLRKEAAARNLLHELEALDNTNSSQSEPKTATSDDISLLRAVARQRLIDMGPAILFLVLKHSRHEGWNYRDDVFHVMSALCDDLVELFTRGIFHKDLEISWSSMKWLRDKCPPDSRAIEALIGYIKDPVHKDQGTMVQSWAAEPLEAWGDAGRTALVNLAADQTASYDAREAAVCSLNADELNVQQREVLKRIAFDSSETEEVRKLITEKLGEAPA
jgi:hypothetical protein